MILNLLLRDFSFFSLYIFFCNYHMDWRWFCSLININIIKKDSWCMRYTCLCMGWARGFCAACAASLVGQIPDLGALLESAWHSLHAWAVCVIKGPSVWRSFSFFVFFPLNSHAKPSIFWNQSLNLVFFLLYYYLFYLK